MSVQYLFNLDNLTVLQYNAYANWPVLPPWDFFYIDLAQQLCIYTPQLYLICQVFIHIKDTEVLKDVFA